MASKAGLILIIICLSLLVFGTLSAPGGDPPVVHAGAHQLPLSKAVTQASTYTASVSATKNSTATTHTFSSSTRWTVNSARNVAWLALAATPTLLSWNGTVDMFNGVQMEIPAGFNGSLTIATVGTLWVNVTFSSTVHVTKFVFNQHSSSVFAPYVFFALKLGAPGFASAVAINMTMTSAPGYNYGSTIYGPQGIDSAATPPGGNGSSVGLHTCYGAHGCNGTAPFPFVWGWSWYGSPPVTTTSFSWAPLTGSGYIQYATAILQPGFVNQPVNATYNSVSIDLLRQGTFHGSIPVTTIQFAGTYEEPIIYFSYSVTFTVYSNSSAIQNAVLYNYTVGGITNSTFFQPTTVTEFNNTISEFTYTIPTPFSTTTKITVKGNSTWGFLSAWPGANNSGYIYTHQNQTVRWYGTMPTAVQVTFIEPTIFASSTLTIVYVPTSPVFSIFGAALPYNAVLTYINSAFAPYQTSATIIGASYNIQTYDVFNHRISQVNVTVTQPNQVVSITLPIWPMSIVNLNSTEVVAINIEHFLVTQQAPDLMPLQTQTFYLTQGLYNFTLQYLGFGGGFVSPPTTFPLNITGVSYSVVTGTTFLNIENTVVNIGNNLTKIITGVNITLLQTNANLESLVNALSEGLFSYHLQAGTGVRTGDTFTIPIVVTTGTGARANYSATQAIQQALVLTYLNGTGSYSTPFFVNGSAPGEFWITITFSASQVAAIEGGTAVGILTAIVDIGNPPGAAAGAIGAAVLESALYANQTANPVSQTVTLDLTNTTRSASTGYYTSTGTWTNDQGTRFSGTLVLTGPWVATATDVTVVINGTILATGTYAVETGQVVVFAGTVSIAEGGTLDIAVTYEAMPALSVASALFQFGGLQVTTPILVIILAAVSTAVVAADDFGVRRTKTADNALAVLLAFVVFGSMVVFT